MATLDSIFIPSSPEDQTGSVNAATSSGDIILRKNCVFAFNATQDIMIKFGNPGMTNATASNFRIPNGIIAVYDTSDAYDRFRIFNNGSSSATWWLQILEKS